MRFKVGDKVKLKTGVKAARWGHRIAVIEAFCPSIAKGAVYLDRILRGDLYWNISDLTKVKGTDGNR